MRLTVKRLYFDDVFECYTLEPVTRPPDAEKVFGKTAIPYGTYQVTITFSGHFQRDMPLVNDVPNFDEIRIHPGNWASNTEGCCLVGCRKTADAIEQSVDAFNALYAKIKAALDSGETVTIQYLDGR